MILLHRLRAQNFKQLADVTLHFPAQGTILIEGHNEAGKSSLFEAVYFALYGKSLITDRDFRAEYLRTYGADELCVELDLSIDGRPCSISRRLKGNQKVTLTLQGEDGTQQAIHTLNAANRRLQEELRISPESLLNTCFVEQKRLERLEALEPGERQATINELLNLRVLTALQAESRVSNEEYRTLQRLKGRVVIARLDAQLPVLEEEAHVACLCLLYSRLRDSEARREMWQEEVAAAQGRQAEVDRRRAEIATERAECDRLRALIRALETDLTLRARAWGDAEAALQQASDSVERLQALAHALPERNRQLDVWQARADQLHILESLEQEYTRQEEALAVKQAEIDGFDRLRGEWERAEAQGETLRTEIAGQEGIYRGAEARRQAREVCNHRMERLRGMLQQVTACTRASEAVEETGAALLRAGAEAERLPALRERLAALKTLEERLQQRDTELRAQNQVQEERAALHRQHEDHTVRLTRIEALTTDLVRLGERMDTAMQEEQRAVTALRSVELRGALETWAAAADRCAETSPSAVADTGLQARVQQARVQQEAAAQAVKQASRRSVPGYILLAVGIAVGLIGAALGQGMGGIAAAVVLAGIGAALAGRGRKAVGDAQAALAQAEIACANLAGEQRAMETQVQSNLAQHQMWTQREQEARTALIQLQATVPATSGEARVQQERLPATPLTETQAAHRAAEDRLRALQTDHELARRTLEAERTEADKTDLTALVQRGERLQLEEERLTTALEAAADLPDKARGLDVDPEPTAVRGALQSCHAEVAAAEAQHNTMADLQMQREKRQEVLQATLQQAALLAQELALPGAEPQAWCHAAKTEQTQLRKEREHTPDAALQEAVHAEQRRLTELERRLAGLETEQSRRASELAAKPRPMLVLELEEIVAALTANTQQRDRLQEVRTELRRDQLADNFQALNLHLAAVQESIKRDTEAAAKLPEVEQAKRDYLAVRQAKWSEFASVWQHILELPLPSSPTEALQYLPIQQREIQERLSARDEAGLQSEDRTLQAEYSRLDRENATRCHQSEAAVVQEQALRTELGVGEGEALDTLPARLSELSRATEQDAVGWEQALTVARDRIREIFSRREAEARLYDVESNRLELRAEEERAAQAEKELAVKKRAGEIVEKTRQAIVSRVMPLTMQNVRQLLPLLTDGRYSDAKWDDATSTVDVYDTRARGFQRKRVFSGGARDQISLALRLGFALATLPGEHNIRPGWLFLDEPLSSFDRTRTLALVDLLTKGLIRREFAQIFLISHSESFDAALFDHRIRMETGRIVETTFAVTP